MKTFRNPSKVHPPLASYAHQVEINAPQRWLILSGQVGMKVDGTLPADPIEQMETALANIKHNLKEANMEIQDLVKLTAYLVGEFNSQERREVVSSWLNGHNPCMTLIYVPSLASPDIKIEIEAIACVDEV
jgi:enamine deaminase RidA (YjgF/YER057c/UK114 family)